MVKLPYWILTISIFLTIVVTYNFYRSSVYRDSLRFEAEVERIEAAIGNKINLYVALLKGGGGFVGNSANLTEDAFAGYVRNLEIEKNYGGLQAIGYGKSVLPFNKQNPAENLVLERILLEPRGQYDWEPLIGEVLSAANPGNRFINPAASGKALISPPVRLNKETAESTAIFIFLPTSNQNETISNVKNSTKETNGVIFGFFRANAFLSEIQKTADARDVEMKIYDSEIKPGNLLAQTSVDAINYKSTFSAGRYQSKREISVAGRKWIVEYETLPIFAERSSIGWTLLILSSGIIFSFFLFGLLYWEVSARHSLQRTADQLFDLQKQKQNLLEKEQLARRAAEQANKTKDEFIAVVSHELKTPLNAISGWTNILKMDNLLSKTKNLALEKIEKNLRLQTEMVEELIEYSQIISGEIEIEDTGVNFSDVFEKSFSAFETKAQEKNIEFIKENRLNGQMISGDEAKIKIVIDNLFSNAVKFTHRGGKIQAVVWETAGSMQMCVTDNGKGISAEFLPLIFERFRQNDSSTTRDCGGLGLGLAITSHIVRLHKGTIEVASDGLDKGSVFTIKLPVTNSFFARSAPAAVRQTH